MSIYPPFSIVTNNPNEDMQVEPDEVTCHVVELYPTHKTLLEKNTKKGNRLQEKKYNVLQLNQVSIYFLSAIVFNFS